MQTARSTRLGTQARASGLDFRGNRRINSVLYIASVTQQRDINDAQIYIARKLGEGETRRAARRSQKRQLANRVTFAEEAPGERLELPQGIYQRVVRRLISPGQRLFALTHHAVHDT